MNMPHNANANVLAQRISAVCGTMLSEGKVSLSDVVAILQNQSMFYSGHLGRAIEATRKADGPTIVTPEAGDSIRFGRNGEGGKG